MILTRLPYITFFSQVVSCGLPFATLNCTIMFLNLQLQKIAPDYFTNGLPSLETGSPLLPPCFLLSPHSPPSIPPFRHPSILSLHPFLVTPPACYSINQWPPPRPGQVLQLPLLGQLIHVGHFSLHFLLFLEMPLILSLCHSPFSSTFCSVS